MKNGLTLLTVVVAICGLVRQSSSHVIHVPGEQPTIQAGIDAASPGDTVEVACDTYYEHGIVMRSGVYLTSETGLPDCVTIDGQDLGRVARCDSVDSSAAIVGFTLTGGRAAGTGGNGDGGGLYCEDSSPTLRNVTFEGNWAEYGGGGMAAERGSPTLSDVTFSGNTADVGGGGFYCIFSSPTMTRVAFTGNWADELAGGAWLVGAGSSPTLTDVDFAGNLTNGSGGGVRIQNYPNVTMTRPAFWDNTAGTWGGGLSCHNASLDISEATFYGNWGPAAGGVHCSSSTMIITDSIVSFSGTGVGVYESGTRIGVTISCSDVYGNAGGNYGGELSDQTGLNGNISEDPLFCDPAVEDFTIDAASPCAPSGNDCELLMGAREIGCDNPVALQSWGRTKALFR